LVNGIDFCCGAGGLTSGLMDAGVEILAGIDVDEHFRDTDETNNKSSRFPCAEIATLDARRLLEVLDGSRLVNPVDHGALLKPPGELRPSMPCNNNGTLSP
jgi:site-specific DNA-cytosine methylase